MMEAQSPSPYVGSTYTVRDLLVRDEKDGTEARVGGDWHVVAYEAEDREVGILGSYYVLVPDGTDGTDEGDWEALAVTVDPDVLIEQIDPERVEREREMESEGLAGLDDREEA